MNKLVLPELTDLNTYINAERSNRYIASSLKKENTGMVRLYVKNAHFKPLEKITQITFVWRHKNKKKDFDNVEASQKFIRDGMVEAGIIPGDGWKHFPPKTTHEHIIDAEHPGVTVYFE